MAPRAYIITVLRENCYTSASVGVAVDPPGRVLAVQRPAGRTLSAAASVGGPHVTPPRPCGSLKGTLSLPFAGSLSSTSAHAPRTGLGRYISLQRSSRGITFFVRNSSRGNNQRKLRHQDVGSDLTSTFELSESLKAATGGMFILNR